MVEPKQKAIWRIKKDRRTSSPLARDRQLISEKRVEPKPYYLRDFLLMFYCIVHTPRLKWHDEHSAAELAETFLNAFQSTLRELVGMACFSLFPFSPFAPGTYSIIYSKEVWQVLISHMEAMTISLIQQQANSSYMDSANITQDLSGALNMETDQVNTMLTDTATSQKRRHVDPPLVVTNVRRSERSTRYQGFKPPSMADNPAKKSYVKPRKIPSALPAVERLPSMSTVGSTSNQTPRPMTIEEIQQIGVNECGVPAEELMKAKLLSETGGHAGART